MTSSEQIDGVDVELALRRMGGPDARDSVTYATLKNAVAAQNGNKAAAARVLGIARTTLRDRLRTGL
jgi:transcriptional regulator of acetoin/glycerol metabolism